MYEQPYAQAYTPAPLGVELDFAHPVSPSFVHPDGQAPHVRPPGVLLHLRLLSHPPLLAWHSSKSESEVVSMCACFQPLFVWHKQIFSLQYKSRNKQHTFAPGVTVVRPSWRTGTTCSTTRRVIAFAFAVTPAIVRLTLVLCMHNELTHTVKITFTEATFVAAAAIEWMPS